MYHRINFQRNENGLASEHFHANIFYDFNSGTKSRIYLMSTTGQIYSNSLQFHRGGNILMDEEHI